MTVVGSWHGWLGSDVAGGVSRWRGSGRSSRATVGGRAGHTRPVGLMVVVMRERGTVRSDRAGWGVRVVKPGSTGTFGWGRCHGHGMSGGGGR
ncbi:hypothetical protein FRACA_650020 [Frankia canadensis]|uniref:Uncharacterized protein n=1 Tax=Frankia canadensis TaxID=1836972 RepID=A0A2I2L037_9ACTN|nr:hypothetical protein FRACA_650020 [Frankia canadensis]SOU58547.1 hypothetical protein FRACA_650020 [Frankia canadensis]